MWKIPQRVGVEIHPLLLVLASVWMVPDVERLSLLHGRPDYSFGVGQVSQCNGSDVAVVLVHETPTCSVPNRQLKISVNEILHVPLSNVVLLCPFLRVDVLQLELWVPLEICSPVKVWGKLWSLKHVC